MGRALSHPKVLEERSRRSTGTVHRAVELKLDEETAVTNPHRSQSANACSSCRIWCDVPTSRSEAVIGETLSHYRILEKLGRGGPASARGVNLSRELWRGLAEAKLESRS